MKKNLLSLLIVGLLTGNVLAQVSQNCSQQLEEAKRAYYNGQFRGVEEKIGDCLNSLSQAERSEAYELLVNTYLVLRNQEQAKNAMANLLTVNPNFSPRESDMVELKQLHDSFEMLSRLSIGLSLGLVNPDYRIVKHQSYGGVSEQPSDYKEIPGFAIGLDLTANIYGNFYGNVGVSYDRRSFKQSETILGLQRISTREVEQRLIVPLQVIYRIPFRPFSPYIGGGPSIHYMLSTRGDLERFSLEPDIEGTLLGIPYSKEGYDLLNLRRGVTANWTLSAGAVTQVSDRLLVDLRINYEHGLNNLIAEGKRYNDDVLLENYAYVTDDFKVSAWRISLGISRNYPKPVMK